MRRGGRKAKNRQNTKKSEKHRADTEVRPYKMRRPSSPRSVNFSVELRGRDNLGGFAVDLDDGVVVDFLGGQVEEVGGFFEVDHAGDGVAAALDVGFDLPGFGVV